MRRGLRGLLAALALLGAGSASAVELHYKWKKGDTHRFRYEDDTTIEMNMPGMQGMGGMMPGMGAGAGMRVKVQSVFSQKVLAVRPDGTADVEFNLEKMDMFQGEQRVASITQVPPAARKVKAEVDRKGRAKFYRMVTLYQQEERLVVGVRAVAGPGGAQASMRHGDTSVSVVAAVNPKTGTVTLAMNEKKHPPELRAVQVKEEDPGVDVLPKQIFEMMVLPEGDLAPGSRTEVATPMGDMAFTFQEQTDKVARLQTQLVGKKTEVPMEAPAEAGEMPQMGGMAMGGMPAGMPGMPGGQQQGAHGGAPSTAGMKTDMEATSGFDVAKGRLLSIEGSGSMDTSMGAGGMKTSSRFTLSRL